MKEIQFKKSIVTLRDDGIMHIHFVAHQEIELKDAILIFEAMGKLGDGHKYPVLIEAEEFVSFDTEVRIFSASAESNIYTLADAIAYISLAQKLIADFYINNNKPTVPTKVFSDKPKAIEWLKTFIKEKEK